jgi:arsenite-transporting ATPase
MRIILYTGKGGVGKTSVAAATALRAAQMGYKTVVMSTDPAHSLADSFDAGLGNEAVSVAPNLWGQEVDVLKELDTHWKSVHEWLSALMRWQGADEIAAEELAILPGMEEMVALLYINRYHEEGLYDLLVVDCAPTAETLRLLSFPDMARWYMNRLFPLERRVAAALGPLVRGMLRVPVPGAEVFDSIQRLYNQIENMRDLLLDHSNSSVRLVMNPEKMVIKEAQRTFTYLNLYGYHTDLVICNRVLSAEMGDGFFSGWKETHDRYLKLIHDSFDPVPVLTAPLMDREVVGLEALKDLGEHLFGQGPAMSIANGDPTKVFHEGPVQEISSENGQYLLTLRLPFTSREDLSVIESRDELVLQVGQYRRNIILPRALVGLGVEDAQTVKDNDASTLRVRFHRQKEA